MLLVGTFSGCLLPLAGDTRSWGLLAALVAVVLGTLLVIPTAGGPLAQGLAHAAFYSAVVVAPLITLPAISPPSMATVARARTCGSSSSAPTGPAARPARGPARRARTI